ncbi:MAG: exosortase system-associated protein, TIGR04073 family [Candidatus Omnitrophota bacterium]|nr:exosortase system-associated protein, TIGR04073 family [Candidatus Omnitrophota bacterium]
MKKNIVILTCVYLFFFTPGVANASGPLEKLGRGIVNVLISPLEIPKGMGDLGMFTGMTWGVLKGTFNVVKRSVVGIYEVISFPVPVPKDYEPILTDPETLLKK